jgi:hypothetical protein
MVSITGKIKNGVILPDESLQTYEGERVLITFLRQPNGVEWAVADGDAQRVSAPSLPPVAYIPPSESLADLLVNVIHEQPLDGYAWNAHWAAIEADMKARDLADDQREGR